MNYIEFEKFMKNNNNKITVFEWNMLWLLFGNKLLLNIKKYKDVNKIDYIEATDIYENIVFRKRVD